MPGNIPAGKHSWQYLQHIYREVSPSYSPAMDFKEHWRARLGEMLSALKVSQAAFAERVGVPPDYVSRLMYEAGKKGRKNLGPVTIRKICDAYGLPHSWFDMPEGSGLDLLATASSYVLPAGEAAVGSKVSEPSPYWTAPSAMAHPEAWWPFKKSTLQRIAAVAKHYRNGGPEPNPLDQIDDVVDVLLKRWESQMTQDKSKAA